MNEKFPKKVIDVTGVELTPGDRDTCLGGDNHPEYPLCCDECDYFLLCFPEYMPKILKLDIDADEDHI